MSSLKKKYPKNNANNIPVALFTTSNIGTRLTFKREKVELL